MGCWSMREYEDKDANGKCDECESLTVDGEAIEICTYSPVLCEKCGWSPCDNSC